MIDTNLWIYAADSTIPEKQRVAQQLIATLAQTGQLSVSAQILNEFYSRITKMGKPPALTAEAGAVALNNIIQVAVVYPVASSSTQSAVALVLRYKLSIWDALILAVAKENGVTTIYTEDLPGGVASGQALEGVVYINPFTPTSPIIQTA